jgi:glucose-1-phosphate cytidylyltransferase
MKVVILAGGFGTRLAEETTIKPKPMVEIGGYPILWHIMKTYSAYGFNDFIIALGYKGYVIKEYFANYLLHTSDMTLDLQNNAFSFHNNNAEPWKVTLIDTGEATMTGGRLKRLAPYIDTDTFMMTYGDGVSNVNIDELIAFHKNHGKLATLTAVQPMGRFGSIEFGEDNQVESFQEKQLENDSWINGGYFVLDKSVLERISDDGTSWEKEPMASLVSDQELEAFTHEGFWQPMDTFREKTLLEDLWTSGKAPWKIWE